MPRMAILSLCSARLPTPARSTEGVPEEIRSRRPASGKGPICVILAHLAEDELATSWRYRQMIQHTGASLLGFDQDEW